MTEQDYMLLNLGIAFILIRERAKSSSAETWGDDRAAIHRYAVGALQDLSDMHEFEPAEE